MRGAATDDTNIIFGATVDERLTGQVWVTVVATGFGQRAAPAADHDASRGAQRRLTRTAELPADLGDARSRPLVLRAA